MKTVDAHGHFVTTLAWGRQSASISSSSKTNGVDGNDKEAKAGELEKLVNVVATGSVDQTVKIWLP